MLTALLGVAFALLLGLGSAATAQTTNPPLVVNDDGNEDDDDRTDGVCATSGGVCTLRAAMTQANNNPGPDAIHFNIPGGGVHTIELGGEELPAINDPSGSVTIDGYTQPGATPNTDPLIFNAEILIEINGQNTDYTFLIQASENLFRGLSIYDTDVAFELLNENADGNVIVGNILGSNHDTTYERPGTGIGIRMNTGPDQNTIGTPDLADRNVISGNGSYGIRINHGPSSFNIIQNNIIGLDRTGTKALNQFIGVDLQFFTFRNQVGGLGPNEGNLMGGHRNGAMDFSHSSVNNSVLGNRIGTLPDGVGIPPRPLTGMASLLRTTRTATTLLTTSSVATATTASGTSKTTPAATRLPSTRSPTTANGVPGSPATTTSTSTTSSLATATAGSISTTARLATTPTFRMS